MCPAHPASPIYTRLWTGGSARQTGLSVGPLSSLAPFLSSAPCDPPPCLSSRPRFPPGVSPPLGDHPTAHGHLPSGPHHPGNRPGSVPPPGRRSCLCGGPRREPRQQWVWDGAAHAPAEEAPPESHHLHRAAAHGPGEEVSEAEVLVHPRQVRTRGRDCSR